MEKEKKFNLKIKDCDDDDGAEELSLLLRQIDDGDSVRLLAERRDGKRTILFEVMPTGETIVWNRDNHRVFGLKSFYYGELPEERTPLSTRTPRIL